MDKKLKIFLVATVIFSFLTIIGGVTFSYFTADISAEYKELDINTAEVSNIFFDDFTEPQVPSDGILPGWIGVSTFTMETGEGTLPDAIGNYKIVLSYEVSHMFNDEITYEIYKTKDPVNNNASVIYGTIHEDEDKFFAQDQLVINGFTDADIISSGSLVETGEMVVDMTTFTGELPLTTYFIVYRFKNLDTLQLSQGEEFTTIISAVPYDNTY